MPTTDNAATTWRDLADQLSKEQIGELVGRESDPDRLARICGNPDRRWTADLLLKTARRYVAHNLGVTLIGDVAPPPDAVRVYEWADADTPDPFRLFEASRRVVVVGTLRYDSEVEVATEGTQHADGAVEREIKVHQLHGDDVLTAQQARELAVALVEAADELDRWAQ
jgi:hypothetical protein